MATQSLMNGLSDQTGISRSWVDEDLNSELSSLRRCPRTMLLGLPCAHCRTYFAAELAACPICGCKDKVPV